MNRYKPISRSLLRALPAITLLTLVGAWVHLGNVQRHEALEVYFDDFRAARYARHSSRIARMVEPENAISAAEAFRADYASLEDSNVFSAIVYVWKVNDSHARYVESLGPPLTDTSSDSLRGRGGGVDVRIVEPGSIVHRNGLRVGDKIGAVDDYLVTDRREHSRAYEMARAGNSDPKAVTLTVYRDGKRLLIQGQTVNRGYSIR